MHIRSCALTLLTTLALCAAAQQPANRDSGSIDCKAGMAAVEQDMAVARAKGQMLRRQQLANELDALRARCGQGTAEPSREAQIEKLEQEIEELRAHLGRAEEQLRKLKGDAL